MEGTNGNDTYIAQGIHDWTDYRGLDGNDTIRMWSGRVWGGAGNDVIERYEVETSVVYLTVDYYEDPGPVEVDLDAGWAHDGYGGTDTLINIVDVHGSPHGGTYRGSAEANVFQMYADISAVDGRGGLDRVILPGSFYGATSDLVFTGALDGSSGVLTSVHNSNLRLDLSNVERIEQQAPDWNWLEPVIDLVDLIAPEQLAIGGLVAAAEQRWNADASLGTGVNVTFSFLASGLRSFTSSEKTAVRGILAEAAAVSGLAFTEVSDGQMRFGISQQATTKGLSFAPTASGAGDAGDVWMDVESMVDLTPGGEGFAALLHEIGHALGLRHPQNVDSGDGWAQQLSDKHAGATYTVMGDEGVGDLYRSSWGPLDVLALQYLYGTKTINAGDTVHAVGGAGASSLVAILDDAGHDRIDASASPVGVDIDMRPFRGGSAGVTAEGERADGNVNIGAGVWIEDITGSTWDDLLFGNELDNRFAGQDGNDWIEGRAGRDTAVFSGMRAQYDVSQVFSTTEVLGIAEAVAGLDVLVSVERLVFADSAIAYDMDGNAGTVAKVLGAVFGPAAVAMPAYAGIGIGLLDGGMPYEELMALALTVRLGGNLSGTAVVNLLYSNVIGAAPSEGQAAPLVQLIESGAMSPVTLAVIAAETPFNAANIGLSTLEQTGLAYL